MQLNTHITLNYQELKTQHIQDVGLHHGMQLLAWELQKISTEGNAVAKKIIELVFSYVNKCDTVVTERSYYLNSTSQHYDCFCSNTRHWKTGKASKSSHQDHERQEDVT